MRDIEKALTVFQGINARDSALATKYIDAECYVEHNPHAGDGVEGAKQYVDRIALDRPELKVIRAYQDGSYVVIQTDGLVLGDSTFFDVFAFDDGLIVEHWLFSAKGAPPNRSGHSQVDGPTDPNPDEDTEKNKSMVREYFETFHIAERDETLHQYFSGDHCVRHEPGVADGVAEFKRDLKFLTVDRTIDKIRFLIGQHDFVFIVADGTHQREPCLYVDLYRAEMGKIVEHWGFSQQVPVLNEQEDNNGML